MDYPFMIILFNYWSESIELFKSPGLISKYEYFSKKSIKYKDWNIENVELWSGITIRISKICKNKKTNKKNSLIFQVLLKYYIRIKKYSRDAGGQIFVIYGQPMDINISISYVLLRCEISYLYTKNCPDLNKGRYLKPSKSRAVSFDRRHSLPLLQSKK
jgi:hypothetical protein